MTMGEKILNMRKARGWSQEELAERIGVTRQAVSRWESNSAKPDADKIIAICDMFGVSADYLLRDQFGGELSARQQDQPQESIYGSKTYSMTQKKWAGVGLISAGSLILLILKLVYVFKDTTYQYNQFQGYVAFLLWEELLLLWFIGFVVLIAGLWLLLLKKRWQESDSFADLKTMFDVD